MLIKSDRTFKYIDDPAYIVKDCFALRLVGDSVSGDLDEYTKTTDNITPFLFGSIIQLEDKLYFNFPNSNANFWYSDNYQDYLYYVIGFRYNLTTGFALNSNTDYTPLPFVGNRISKIDLENYCIAVFKAMSNVTLNSQIISLDNGNLTIGIKNNFRCKILNNSSIQSLLTLPKSIQDAKINAKNQYINYLNSITN